MQVLPVNIKTQLNVCVMVDEAEAGSDSKPREVDVRYRWSHRAIEIQQLLMPCHMHELYSVVKTPARVELTQGQALTDQLQLPS